jgi:hypothetical protein
VASAREIELAARALGIPESLADEPEKPSRSKRAPVVIRKYVPDERAQLKAIASLLRDAINTLPTKNGAACPAAPNGAKEIEDGLHAATGSIPR